MAEQHELKQEAEKILKMGQKVLDTTTKSVNPNSAPEVKEEKFHEFRIAATSWLSRVFGENHSISQAFKSEVTHATAARTRRGIGILEAARGELSSDWLTTTKGAVAKDVLSDILRLAQAQKEAGNLRAAAIICGTVIDQLLRRLCMKAGISLVNDQLQGKAMGKKALQLTGEAYKKKIYERTTNKQLISWIELFNEVTKDDSIVPDIKRVEKMLGEVRKIVTAAQL